MEIVDFLLDPWRSGITSRALLETTLIALAAGPLGCWVVLYGLSYSAESLSHALFPGLVIGSLAGLPLEFGALLGVAIAAPAIVLAGRLRGIGADAGVAVAVTSLLGLGALLALAPDTPRGVRELLFGDVLGVSDGELVVGAALAGGVLAALGLAHGRLMLVGFDRASARAFGARPGAADLMLVTLVGAFTVIAVQALGSLLILALLVGPAASAREVTHRLGPMMALAASIAVLAGVGGLYVSYHAGTAGGASIAATVVALHLLIAAAAGASARRPAPVRA
jgi:ABC-type Mn2+/Zn2+ transport system permease subunit